MMKKYRYTVKCSFCILLIHVVTALLRSASLGVLRTGLASFFPIFIFNEFFLLLVYLVTVLIMAFFFKAKHQPQLRFLTLVKAFCKKSLIPILGIYLLNYIVQNVLGSIIMSYSPFVGVLAMILAEGVCLCAGFAAARRCVCPKEHQDKEADCSGFDWRGYCGGHRNFLCRVCYSHELHGL